MVTVTAITQPNLTGATITCPNGATATPFNCSLNLPLLSFTTAGSYNASVTVTDGINPPVVQPISITVQNVNRAPVLTAIPNQIASDGQTLNVPLASTDPDPEDTNRTFSVTNVVPAAVGVTFTPSGTNNGNLQIVVAGNAPTQTLTVTVTVNDNDAVAPQAAGSGPLTASQQFTLDVNPFMVVDDITGETLEFDQAGHYSVINCRKSTNPILTGTGTVTTNGCKMMFGAGAGKGATTSISATVNTCTGVGTATIVNGGTTTILNDANVKNDALCH